MLYAQATFINCTFQNSRGVASGGSAGGISVVEYSTAFFFNCKWTGNSSTTYGGGLEVSISSKAYVHQSRFLYNITNPQGHSSGAAGGAGVASPLTIEKKRSRVFNDRYTTCISS